jgi:hypothetical protein
MKIKISLLFTIRLEVNTPKSVLLSHFRYLEMFRPRCKCKEPLSSPRLLPILLQRNWRRSNCVDFAEHVSFKWLSIQVEVERVAFGGAAEQTD